MKFILLAFIACVAMLAQEFTLPPSLEIVEATSMKRKYGQPLLNKVFGSTPWGLCDVAIVQPLAASRSRQ